MYEKHAPKQAVYDITAIEEDILSQLADITFSAGDIIFYDGTKLTNLGVGSDNQLFTLSGGLPVWEDAPSGMVYPGAGIALSTGSAWGTSIANNSANWNTAYGWGNHASAGYLLATGATTGATSQAQTFTKGVNLSNLTSGRVPFATTAGFLTDSASLTFDSVTGSLSATYFIGDGSGLENVGQTAATSVTFSAKAGEALKKGQAVYINGGASALPTVFKADNTTLDKTRVVGLAVADATINSAVLIRRYGTLTLVDTQATNTDINPNAETWLEGDLLFAITGGGLTKVRPTSGRSVKVAYSLKGSSNTDTLLVYPLENPVWVTCAQGEDVVARLGDNGGTNKFSVRDYSNTEVAYIDSDGTLSIPKILINGTTDTFDYAGVTYSTNFLSTGTSSTTLNSVWLHYADTNTQADQSTVVLARARGSASSKAIVQNNDFLGEMVFAGYNGTDWSLAARIFCEVEGTPGNNDMPGALLFATTPDGSKTLADRMKIDNAGNIISYIGILPDINDGAYLGSATLGFSDLFLASGGVINWDNGDVTLTHSANALTFAGGTVALGSSPTMTTPVITTWDGWITAGDSWSYASATTITVPSGAASKYSKGDKIKITQTTAKYFVITNVADTVLTVYGGSDYTVANATITLPYYSHSDSPVGFPDYFNYTVTAASGITLGNATSTGKIYFSGKTFTVFGDVIFGDTTSISGTIKIYLPLVGSTIAYYASGLSSCIEIGSNAGQGIIFKEGNIIWFTSTGGMLGTNQWNATVPFTWGTLDELSWTAWMTL